MPQLPRTAERQNSKHSVWGYPKDIPLCGLEKNKGAQPGALQTPPSAPLDLGERREEIPPMGAAVTDSSTEMFIPTPGCPQKGLGTSRGGDLSPEEKSIECRKERC